MTGAVLRAAVFLDRDGVLNEVVMRGDAPVAPRELVEFRVVDGAVAAVQRISRAGYPVFVVTNQPDLARGTLDPGEHARIVGELRAVFELDDIAVCPHDDADRCACRKPLPGLLRDLAARHGIDLARSVVVGDTWKDIEAGRRAGCRTVLLRRAYNEDVEADIVVSTIGEAAEAILGARGVRV